MSDNHTDIIKRIKLLILDVDGVLTDGKIIYNDGGEETKAFNVKDGLGIRLLLDAGLHVAIITGRRSEALRHRCRDLGISLVFEGISDKAGTLNTILTQLDIGPEETAAIGDDLPDLPLLRAVGYAVTVADAPETLRCVADSVTSADGGCGAVREVCETILKARGIWDDLIEKWTG